MHFTSSVFSVSYKGSTRQGDGHRPKSPSPFSTSAGLLVPAMSHTLMIIDFEHSFKNYDEILCFYGIWDCSCPGCGARRSMHRHGKYHRNLILWEDGRLLEISGWILRLKCSSCGRTHAVLTMDMIPFFSYSLPAFLALIGLCLRPDGSVPKTERDTGVSYQLLYRMLLIFHEYRERLVLLLRRESLWGTSASPLLRQLLPLMGHRPPPWMPSAFFRSYRSPVFLHRRITGAFPLSFGLLSRLSGQPT